MTGDAYQMASKVSAEGHAWRITPLSKWLVKGITNHVQLDSAYFGDLLIMAINNLLKWDAPPSGSGSSPFKCKKRSRMTNGVESAYTAVRDI